MHVPPVDAAAITRAVQVLRRGGLVAIPTETVYGLAADADNEQAVRALFAAKGRPADHPVIVHIAGVEAIDAWARDVPESARTLAAAFWPGPLTLLLKRSARARDIVTGAQDTVGLRAPLHPWMRAVLREFGGGLAVPSANSFGRISPTIAQHVIDDLGIKPRGKVDLVLDGGACMVGIESTIVDLSTAVPTLLRPGSITREQLQAVIGRQVLDADALAPRASGRLEKHYAPRTPLSMLALDELAMKLASPSEKRLAVLAPLHLLQDCRAQVTLAIAASEDATEYAHSLYANLHRLDKSGADKLLVAAPPATGPWEAVHDRLQRAQAGSSSK
jgi:L-threonylcarbamoyladenylate synthase